ncbi:MAG: hypothetical protein PHS17_19545 [Desulfobacterales bacterium]|nr:hypothetical protein [Desulfobacterales bacterium]
MPFLFFGVTYKKGDRRFIEFIGIELFEVSQAKVWALLHRPAVLLFVAGDDFAQGGFTGAVTADYADLLVL